MPSAPAPEEPTLKILFCNCSHYDVVPDTVRAGVLGRLNASGLAFRAVPDLCGLAARRDPALKEIAGDDDIRIAACFPRTVRWLFHAAGAPLPERGVVIANMRTLPVEGAADALLAGLDAAPDAGGDAPPEPHAELAPGPDDWVPWFPIIDYARCIDCGQCLNFCLFGVYDRGEDGRVDVRNPDKCKTNCPACARVCPQTAIIFPKYRDRPINGDDVRPEDLKRADMAVDAERIRKTDVYERLRARQRPGG